MAKQIPKVYSYARFSTPEQSVGDSERRQREAADAWVKQQKLPLDTDLMIDRGLSGFHGTHKTKGALGQFLKKVEAGEIAKGSVLLVQNIDRLSRQEPTTALTTVIKIVEAGITIQTLSPLTTYTRKSINDNLIYELIGQIKRSYKESKRKSELTISNRKKKRAEARNGTAIFTALRPAWLNLVDSQGKSISKGIRGRHDYDLSTTKFKVIPEAAKAIRMIFNAKLKGVTMNAIFDQYDLTKAERKELYGFACYVNKQAATKRGRFIRAIFKSKHSEKKHVSKSGLVYARPHAGQNRRVDLVPKGSIALGMELIKNDKRRKAGWRFVSGGVSYRLTLKNYGTNTHRC